MTNPGPQFKEKSKSRFTSHILEGGKLMRKNVLKSRATDLFENLERSLRLSFRRYGEDHPETKRLLTVFKNLKEFLETFPNLQASTASEACQLLGMHKRFHKPLGHQDLSSFPGEDHTSNWRVKGLHEPLLATTFPYGKPPHEGVERFEAKHFEDHHSFAEQFGFTVEVAPEATTATPAGWSRLLILGQRLLQCRGVGIARGLTDGDPHLQTPDFFVDRNDIQRLLPRRRVQLVQIIVSSVNCDGRHGSLLSLDAPTP
jgi:hypothetical protein